MTAGKDGVTGRFLPGNRFWEARSSHGAKPKFENGEDLWKACTEYFEWVEANPLWEDKLVTFQGMATHEPVAKMRAMTISGLCFFIDIDKSTWDDWKKSRPDLSGIISRAEGVIRDQKFAGAAADLLNANIIARDLGYAEKNEHTGKDGGPVQFQTIFEAKPDD
ncbi:DNA-packaging protein [Martelella sp. FOR1707]